eukprot:10776084-Ditylum_brightwellii.AAC.1
MVEVDKDVKDTIKTAGANVEDVGIMVLHLYSIEERIAFQEQTVKLMFILSAMHATNQDTFQGFVPLQE